MSKVDTLIRLTKDIVDKQEKEREILGQILLSIVRKEEGEFTSDDWEMRRYEVLKGAGLKTPELSYNAMNRLRRKRIKEKTDEREA